MRVEGRAARPANDPPAESAEVDTVEVGTIDHLDPTVTSAIHQDRDNRWRESPRGRDSPWHRAASTAFVHSSEESPRRRTPLGGQQSGNSGSVNLGRHCRNGSLY